MNRPPSETRIGFSAIMASLAFSLATALLTGILLLINGSIVLVLLKSLSTTGPGWIQGPSVLQFVLFTVPVLMVVMQWIFWDVARGLFSRQST